MYEYREIGSELIEEVKEIYRQEEWFAYLRDDEALVKAYNNSIYCLGVFENNKLVGFIRCVGDGEHVILIQDLIISPAHQRKGIGTRLFKMTAEKYSKVRMFQVNTDLEDERDNRFYQKMGMKPIIEGNMISYFR